MPKLKLSLSLTLHQFLPLAGNIVWPSNSPKPIIQYNPGDSVSFTIAISYSHFSHVLDNSPCDSSQSRAFVPNLDSSDSFASVISLQITLFPNSGFCIGMSSHHACLDRKSSTMFIKAWAYLCRTQASKSESSILLPQELQPFLDREAILDPRGIADAYIKGWSGFVPNQGKLSLRILSEMFVLKVDGSARATFKLKPEDLNKIKERVLQKWNNDGDKIAESMISKPRNLSTYVITTSYVLICLAKAMERSKQKVTKIIYGFQVDCRNRLEPPISETYFGNCVMGHLVEIQLEELENEDAVAIVAKKIQRKISIIHNEKGALHGADTLFSNYSSLLSEDGKAPMVGVAGSTRFGVYQADFGWGKPEKVEITSVDRGITIAMAESKARDGGVEVGLVLKKNVMDEFACLFPFEPLEH